MTGSNERFAHTATEAMREAFEAYIAFANEYGVSHEITGSIITRNGKPFKRLDKWTCGVSEYNKLMAEHIYQAALQSPQVKALKRELETVKARYEYLCGLDASSQDLRALVEAAQAVLYHDERGQGILYEEAMNAMAKALAPFTGASNGK